MKNTNKKGQVVNTGYQNVGNPNNLRGKKDTFFKLKIDKKIEINIA